MWARGERETLVEEISSSLKSGFCFLQPQQPADVQPMLLSTEEENENPTPFKHCFNWYQWLLATLNCLYPHGPTAVYACPYLYAMFGYEYIIRHITVLTVLILILLCTH